VAGTEGPAATPAPVFQAIEPTTEASVAPSDSSAVPAAVPSATSISPECTTPSSAPLVDALRPDPASTRSAAVSTTRPVAAFLGDSYTSGYVGAGLGRAGWPAIVGASLDLRPDVRAVPGTGFVNPGWTEQPIRTQASGVIGARPRIVFVAGGHNDRRFSTSRSTKAADAVLDRLRRALPDSILVVIGPIWQDGSPPASLRALRDHLRRKAAAIDAIFIDPLRDGWFAGSARGLIGPDGVHPTDAGHRHIAKLVLRAVQHDPQVEALSGAHLAGLRASPTATPEVTGASSPLAPCVP
jgi:lysophospholipase L1-like esterase